VQDQAGMVAAWMGMKRGCRTVIAASSSEDFEDFVEPLRKWDVRLKVLDLPANGDPGELVRIARAEAVFLGTRWDELDPKTPPEVGVPIFEPVIGLTEEGISKIAARIRAAV